MLATMIAVALTAAQPAPAAPAPAAPAAPAPAPAPLDPARLAAAERMVAAMLPPGSLQRAMAGSMPGLDAMMDMRPADFGITEPTGEGAESDNRTLAEIGSERDPHFRERMRISTRVSAEVMGEMMVEMEPEIRAVLARYYARHLTVAELDELTAFFGTQAGRRFIESAFTMIGDPMMMELMGVMMPRMTQMLPEMQRRITEATAHLPPPPPVETMTEEATSEGEED